MGRPRHSKSLKKNKKNTNSNFDLSSGSFEIKIKNNTNSNFDFSSGSVEISHKNKKHQLEFRPLVRFIRNLSKEKRKQLEFRPLVRFIRNLSKNQKKKITRISTSRPVHS